MTKWISAASGPIQGELRVPGDKSISHRAIMLAALADGVSHIDGFLEGDDTRATAAAFVQMGVRIDAPEPCKRSVHGVGLQGLRAPNNHIDCGNAGTGMRLLTGVLVGQAFDSVLVGDASLSRRPMRRIIEPLSRMSADIVAGEGGVPPLHVRGARNLSGIEFTSPVASAQVKSAVLLAGLYAANETCVRELHPTRDYTERMLAAFGWPIEYGPGWAKLTGGNRLTATDVCVPTDFSSAAFFIVAASIVPGSHLLLRDVGMNPRRTGLLHALRAMGADIREANPRTLGGEPVADLEVRHAHLRGIDVAAEWVPDMIDEFPILFVAAAAAKGTTRFSGAAELRVKESDRLAVMAKGLRALGIQIRETPDGAIIEGGRMLGARLESAGDHRCAMSFAVAGQVAQGEVRIDDCDNVATSFPGFVESANACGFALQPLLVGCEESC